MASCRQSRLVVTCQPGSLNYLTSSGRLELVPPYSPFFFACRTELIAWNVLYRRDAQLRLAACHEIRQRVRAATHSPIGASYYVRRDVHRKAGCPDTFGIAFASMQCRWSDEMASRRSQSRASNGSSQQRGIDHEIANFHPVVSHLAGTPPVDRVPVDSICALAHALDRVSR